MVVHRAYDTFVDRRWWNPILIVLATLSIVGLIALTLIQMYSWHVVAMAVIAVGSLVTLSFPLFTRDLGHATAPPTRPWFAKLDGSCPDCGYPGEGIEGGRCPECNGHIPPGLASIAALKAVHDASGPAECVVCHAVHANLPAGTPCPDCGSRRRKSLAPHPR